MILLDNYVFITIKKSDICILTTWNLSISNPNNYSFIKIDKSNDLKHLPNRKYVEQCPRKKSNYKTT